MMSRTSTWIATGSLGAVAIVGLAFSALATPDQQVEQGTAVVINTTPASTPGSPSAPGGSATPGATGTPGATSTPVVPGGAGGSVAPTRPGGSGADGASVLHGPVQVPAPQPAPYSPPGAGGGGGGWVDASADSADSGD